MYSILFNLFDCYITMKYLNFMNLGIIFLLFSLFSVGITHSLSETDASEFVYDYIEGDEYYTTTHFISFQENYTFINIDGDLRFIVTEDLLLNFRYTVLLLSAEGIYTKKTSLL